MTGVPDRGEGRAERFAVRIHGRGVVTEFNGKYISDRKTAEQIVRSVELMYGERCTLEQLLYSLSTGKTTPVSESP